ncbi:MAG: triple tyrosine motif-containing protein, partial [Bacteroidota bacterium]
YADWKDYYDPFDGQRFEALSNTAGQVWGLKTVGTELLLGHHEGAFKVREGQAELLSGRTGSWTFLQPEATTGWLVEGTYTGLNVYRSGPDQQWAFWAKPEGLEESCRLMAQDDQGFLWIAHPYRGVYRVKLQADGKAFESVRLYTAEDGFPSDLNTHVFNINGELVFTGETGVFTYNRQADRFEPHEQFADLFGMDIRLRQLVRDGQGNIWYATEEEVGLVTVTDKGLHKELSKQTFPQLRKSLVGGFEFIYPYDAHNVFFGTTKGFIHFNPALLRPVDVNPIIRQVSVVGNPDSIIFGGNHFTTNGIVADQPSDAIPELTHRENNLRFTVSATNFEQWQDLSFAYFLEGFDDAWSASMVQQEKEYTNLGPGEYTFQVRIIGPDGQVGAQREYRFRIAPAWYRSNWAYALYVLVLLCVILGLILVPRRQYEKEKAQLRSEQEETLKQKELQHEKALEQSERAIMKLRNEKLRSEVSHKNSELASATMHLVQKGEMLHTIRNELIKAQESTVAPKVQQVLRQIIRMINADGQLDRDWDQFERYFDQVHVNFLQRLRENFPELTPKDIKLCAYLRINLSTKEIAPLMNISVRGVEISRYRLRKKLGLEKEDNLVEFITQV